MWKALSQQIINKYCFLLSDESAANKSLKKLKEKIFAVIVRKPNNSRLDRRYGEVI